MPVLHNLASPQTGFGQLFVALDKAAKQVAPVAETQATLFVELDTFFTAFAGASSSLERTIEGGPAALRQAIHSLPYEEPLIEKTTEFIHLLRPSAHILRTTAAPLGHAFEVGAVNLRAAVALNKQLASALHAFEVFAEDPVVGLGPRRIHADRAARHPAVGRARPRADHLQLRHARVPQRRQPARRERRSRHARAGGADPQPLRNQRRGPPRLSTGQRALKRL